jgi:outer membrane protein
MRSISPTVLLAITIALTPKPAAAAPLTLPTAIDRALAHDPRLRQAEARVAEAQATRKSVRGAYGPRLQLDANALYWFEPSKVRIIDPAKLDLSSVPELFQPMLSGLVDQISVIDVRERATYQVQVGLVQPLTQLYSVYHGHAAAQHGEAAAASGVVAMRREVTFRVTEAYYRVVMAERVAEVAQEAVATLDAHVADAARFREAGLIGPDELLAAEVEAGNAREALIRARNGVALARAALASLMGAPLDQPFALAPVPEDGEPPAPPDTPTAQAAARRARPELAALRALAGAATEQHKVARWQLTPQVSAVARYQYQKGVLLEPTNEVFAGAVLSWNLWDWGGTYYRARAAEAVTRQAESRVREAEDLIALEVTQRRLAIDAARERLAVGRVAERQAAEALRVARQKFEQHVVGSTAVLDAQTRRSRAQASRIGAQHELIVAVAALRYAMGSGASPTVLPTELTSGRTP